MYRDLGSDGTLGYGSSKVRLCTSSWALLALLTMGRNSARKAQHETSPLQWPSVTVITTFLASGTKFARDEVP